MRRERFYDGERQGGIPLEKVEFTVPGLEQDGNAQDVSNAVVGISGVCEVSVEPGGHIVFVEYDPILTSAEMVKTSIEKAGYPIEMAGEPDR